MSIKSGSHGAKDSLSAPAKGDVGPYFWREFNSVRRLETDCSLILDNFEKIIRLARGGVREKP